MTEQEFCWLTQDPIALGLISGDDEWGGCGTWYYLWTRKFGRSAAFEGRPAISVPERYSWVETTRGGQPLRLDLFLKRYRERRRERRRR